MGRNQQPKGSGCAWKHGNKSYASGGKGGGNKKTVDAATALGLGVPQQNTMLSGLAGLGMVQPTPLDSLFGYVGTNTMVGLGGLDTGLQSANGGNDLLQLAALLGGTQQQPVSFQPGCRAQLLQVRQALAQQQATQVAAQQAEIQKRIEAETATRVAELVKTDKETQKQKSAQDTNATKQDEDDTASRKSAGGRSQGARKCKAIAEANAEKVKGENERDELKEALNILEAHLGVGMRPYDSEDGTRPSRVTTSSMARVLRSVSKKGARQTEPAEVVDLDEEDESVSERAARLITLQANHSPGWG